MTIIRPTAVFGPGNRGNVYNLMRQISRRRFVMIGTGDYVKSLAYVSSLADFICRQVSMQNGYKLYNFVDHPQLRMVEVVEIIHKALGLKFNRHVRLPGQLSEALVNALLVLSGLFPMLRFNILRRIKKFLTPSHFEMESGENENNNKQVLIKEHLIRTVEFEFIRK